MVPPHGPLTLWSVRRLTNLRVGRRRAGGAGYTGGWVYGGREDPLAAVDPTRRPRPAGGAMAVVGPKGTPRVRRSRARDGARRQAAAQAWTWGSLDRRQATRPRAPGLARPPERLRRSPGRSLRAGAEPSPSRTQAGGLGNGSGAARGRSPLACRRRAVRAGGCAESGGAGPRQWRPPREPARRAALQGVVATRGTRDQDQAWASPTGRRPGPARRAAPPAAAGGHGGAWPQGGPAARGPGTA